jgi:hypothetical protein
MPQREEPQRASILSFSLWLFQTVMARDVILTDEEYKRWANKFLDLQIEFGFVLESEREAELEWMLETFCRHKPLVTVGSA